MDRNEILANFQACTGIDDLGQCIATLEQCDWNMNEAVSVALAGASSPSPPRDLAEDLTMTGATPSIFRTFGGALSTAGDPERIIHFEVKLNSTIKHISLDETAPLATLRDLASVELGIPRKEVKFYGWPNHVNDSMPDSTTLHSLHLPLSLTLTVHSTAPQNGATDYTAFGLRNNVTLEASGSSFPLSCTAVQETDDMKRLADNYCLIVTDKRTNQEFTLNLAGSKTLAELKYDVHTLMNIVPSKQIWEGLTSDPSTLTSDRTVASLNLNVPVHNCSVAVRQDAPPQTLPIDLTQDEEMEIDDELEDFADASENYSNDMLFVPESCASKSTLQPLMPQEATDEVGALTQFQSEFNSRYGDTAVTPQFFIDTLDAAIQEAFGGPARNRRLLAVYLHHEKSIQSNIFCSQLLCAPSVVEYMASHCVTWAWDVTSDFNKKRLLDMCSRLLGSGVSDTVKRIQRDGFPMLILAQGRGRSCEVNSIIQGNTTLDELMVKLIKAVEDAESQKQEDVRMEEISEARERIKREQEVAYAESLQKDKEKQKRIDEEKAKLEKEERDKLRIEQERNNKMEELSLNIPPEPAADCGLPVTKIRFRPPGGGEMITRTFLASDKLEVLINFVASLGFFPDKYRIISSYPKREISSLDFKMTLESHKLFPQDTLIIEERVD